MIQTTFQHVRMPGSCDYTCGILTNNMYSGLLHVYVRHHPELEQHIAGLSAIRVSLPETMQKALNGITAAFNMAAAAADITVFNFEYNSSRSVRMVLYKAQLMVLTYLQSVMSNGSQPMITSNAFGKYQLRYSVESNAELVVGPTDDMKAAVKKFGDVRPIEYGNNRAR
uniref:WS_DGAT_C domain-containing protein n=1 Tax=Panagrellus redivivus TaxID=6233 RepID=A0A7E4ZVE8_PANRE